VQALRTEHQSLIELIASGRLKFLDECGVHIAMTRLYGRALRGQRVVDKVPDCRGENLSILAAIGLEGCAAALAVDGAVDGIVFDLFVMDLLVPTLKPGDIVVWDNLNGHKSVAAREAIEAAGAEVLFLPPYSPDLNPIEKMWSKVKAILRAEGARTREALHTALRKALACVTAKDIRAWFAHCGYDVRWA
jgi:transposase